MFYRDEFYEVPKNARRSCSRFSWNSLKSSTTCSDRGYKTFLSKCKEIPDDVTVLLLKLHVTFAVEIWLAEKADHVVGHYRKEKRLVLFHFSFYLTRYLNHKRINLIGPNQSWERLTRVNSKHSQQISESVNFAIHHSRISFTIRKDLYDW